MNTFKSKIANIFEAHTNQIMWDELTIFSRIPQIRDSKYIENILNQLSAKPFNALPDELKKELWSRLGPKK